jgi:hypothetical protein
LGSRYNGIEEELIFADEIVLNTSSQNICKKSRQVHLRKSTQLFQKMRRYQKSSTIAIENAEAQYLDIGQSFSNLH